MVLEYKNLAASCPAPFKRKVRPLILNLSLSRMDSTLIGWVMYLTDWPG